MERYVVRVLDHITNYQVIKMNENFHFRCDLAACWKGPLLGLTFVISIYSKKANSLLLLPNIIPYLQ